MTLRIEPCTLKDLDALTQIARKTFIIAFESQNNPEDFKNYLDTILSEEGLAVELEHPNSYFFFVKMKKTLLGYFKLNEGNAQSELLGDDSMELERIYVCEEYQGKGIGAWVLEQAIAQTRRRNKSFLWLGVWEHNTAAIRFYQRNGFAKFGEHPYYVGADKQMDWLMRLDLVTLEG